MSRTQSRPRISIVTPSFNQGDYLEQTICSVLDQNYADLEYILIDGGSTDRSVEIIKRYERHFKYWVSEPDRGQTHAINKGFRYATGDIFAYLNSDDLYEPNILDTVAQHYSDSGVSNRFWKAYVVKTFNQGGQIDTVFPDEDCSLPTWLSTSFGLLQPGVFWSREMHHQVGGFDEELHYVFDRNFFMQLLKLGYTYTTSQSIVAARYRIHENAKTQKHNDRFQREYGECDRAFIKSFPISKRISLSRAATRSKAWGRITNSSRTGIGRRDRILNLALAALCHPRVICSPRFWNVVRHLPNPEHQS